MRQTSLIVLGFALALPTMAAQAETSDAALVAGLGATPCSDFAKADDAGRAAYVAWAEGWMSGVNNNIVQYQDTPIPLSGADTMSADQQLAYLVDHCRLNPDAPFFSAAADLFSALSDVAGQ